MTLNMAVFAPMPNASASNFADLLLQRFHAAHLESRLARGFFAPQPRTHFVLDRVLRVAAQLFIELAFRALLAEQSSQSSADDVDEAPHTSPDVASKMRVIAALWACHSRASLLSFLRPASVSM